MTREFPGVPEDAYEYRNEFDYSVWTPGTRVIMCNVGWDSTYKDVVWWDSTVEREQWVASLTGPYANAVTIESMVYLKYGEPVRIDLPFSQACRYNYLIVDNPRQPVPGSGTTPERFYYFVTDCSYLSPNCTALNVQLDVWATYYERLDFGVCYVERSHIGIANENSTPYNLADYLTDDEGLNVGNEYEVVAQHVINLSPVQEQPDGTLATLQPYALFMCSCDLSASGGTADAPKLTSSPGSVVEGIPQGCKVYVAKAFDFTSLMNSLKGQPWVAQCITYVTLVPETMVPFDTISPVEGFSGVYEVSWYRRVEDSMEIGDVLANFKIPSAFSKLYKLYTSPYCVIEITAQSGGEIVAKPECLRIDSETDTMSMVRMYSLVPPDVRMMVFFEAYNAAEGTTYEQYRSAVPVGVPPWVKLYAGEGLDMALAITDFPQLSVVTDGYQLYLANNRNAISYAYQSAGWGQQKALAAAQLGYDQASKSREVVDSMLAASTEQNRAQAGLGVQAALMGGLGSLVGSGTPTGAVGALGSTAASIYSTVRGSQIAQDYMAQTASINADQIEYNRDTNYEFANFAARGDYQNAVAAIQAKVEDAKMTQPTTAGQIGGMAFNYVNGYNAIVIKWKRLKPNFLTQVGGYFLRYGYYVNRFMTPPSRLKCMTDFDYWKMKDVQIVTTEIPEVFKQTIRGILEKGVTIWRTAADVGRVSPMDNEPVEGVSY